MKPCETELKKEINKILDAYNPQTVKLKEEIRQIIEDWNPCTINKWGKKERWLDGCVGEIYQKVKGNKEEK